MLFEKIRTYRPMMAFHSLNFYGVDHKLNEPDMKALRTRFLYLDESCIQRDFMPYVENILHVNQHGHFLRDRKTTNIMPETVILEQSRLGDMAFCDF